MTSSETNWSAGMARDYALSAGKLDYNCFKWHVASPTDRKKMAMLAYDASSRKPSMSSIRLG